MSRSIASTLDEQRGEGEDEDYCTLQWSDTKKVEVIPQTCLCLPAKEKVRSGVTYTIDFNGSRRCGTVMGTGE